MNKLQQTCIYKTMQAIGDKWTPLILREITDGSCRFTSLQKSLESIKPRISPRTLAQRLEYMVQIGILEKKTFAEMPPRIEYTLTEKGEDLIPVLAEMSEWGTKYLNKV